MIDHSPSISILGAGWLGLPLGQWLASKGYAVKGSTTRTEKLAELKKAGLSPFLFKTGEAIQGPNIDTFFQSDILFLNIPPGRRRPDVAEAFPREVQLILQKALEQGVKKILFISSTSVYSPNNQLAKETDTLEATTGSGQALIQVEQMLQACPIDWMILRLSGLVGGDRKAGRFFAGRQDIPGGLSPVNMVHRQDCIQVIYQLLQKDEWGKIFNVCADEHPTRADFYTAQARKQDFALPTFLPNQQAHKIVSNEALKAFLNYEFIHPDPMNF